MNERFAPPAAAALGQVPRDRIAGQGVKAWLVESYAVPIVSLELAFRGGATQDPQGRYGATTIMSGLLDEGAGDLDSQAFHRALDDKAIEIGFHADQDKISGRLRTLSKNLDRAGALLALALNAPRFDEEPFERVREQIKAHLRHEMNDPGTVAWRGFQARAYSTGIPIEHPSDGSARDRSTLCSCPNMSCAASKNGLRGTCCSVGVVGAIERGARGAIA